MRLLVQRVRGASVSVAGEQVATIDKGLLVLAGFAAGEEVALHEPEGPLAASHAAAIEKLLALRIFPDPAGKMNLDIREAAGALLLVPQFTLYAETRKGRRPSFSRACAPEAARELFARMADNASSRLGQSVALGIFGADMDVALVNWGPVTFMLDSADYLL